MRILLAGATGLVGNAILSAAQTSGHRIITAGRRATGRVADEVITDFSEPLELPKADAAICALGTTVRSAGSQQAFRNVDHDAVLSFARAALRSGVSHFALVSAAGADPESRVFYSRIKGETERELQALPFTRLDIAQPGLLLGARKERRPVERLLQRLNPVLRHFMLGPLDCYAGIADETVAAALLALCRKGDPGVYRHRNRELLALAHTYT